MEYRYENIESCFNIPIKIFTQTLEEFPYHWHEEIEILFILKGAVEIFIDKEVTVLSEGDIFLINKNEIHYVKSQSYLDKSQLLVLQINDDYFKKFNIDLNNFKFKLNSDVNKNVNKKVYNKIRSLLANMMNVVINKEEPGELLIYRYLLDLVIILINNFPKGKNLVFKISNDRENRFLDVIKYINKNYEDTNLNINKIANNFYLNPQYLSRYFKENVGISIKGYMENLRLNKSLKALALTKDRVIDIVNQYGFPDEKAYYRVFKKIIGVTPNQYREMNSVEVVNDNKIEYLNINSSEALAKLFEYIKIEDEIHETRKININKSIIKTEEAIDKINYSWRKLLTFGHATYGLREDFNNQLQEIQEELNFEYIRFHGIFSDELLVYNEGINGEVYYNFNHIDRLLDSILSKGLKPFIELGFMPKELSITEDKIFYWSGYISKPNDMNKWCKLIEAFIKHIINKYGILEIRKWYFEFWNEPNLEMLFWNGSREEFFEFFKEIYTVIKAIDEKIKVGGFGVLKLGEFQTWMEEYIIYANKNKIKLDFFSFHVYLLKSIKDLDNKKVLEVSLEYIQAKNKNSMKAFIEKQIACLGDKNHIHEIIMSMKKLEKELDVEKNELWITEWNSTMECRDLTHDTCYMAAFIVKTCIESSNLVKGIGFWTFTDLFEEFRLEQKLFHGGFGLLTFNGLKKPSYHAFSFLNKLGNEVVYKKDGLIITKNIEGYQILIYNYCHFNALYASLDYSQISEKDRYNVFEDVTEKIYDTLIEIDSGNYIVEKHKVNRDEGSVFDGWLKMGAPEELTDSGYKYLKKEAECGYEIYKEKINKYFNLNTEVLTHEIQLITLKKIY